MSALRQVFSHLSLLVSDNAHWGSRAVVNVFGLNPLVTGLGVRYVVCVLCTNLTVVVHLVAKGIGVVTFIDGALAGEIKLVMGWLLWGMSHQRLFPVGVVKVCLLKESDAVWAESSSTAGFVTLESTLVLRLTAEAAIARLEVGARDVWLGELV